MKKYVELSEPVKAGLWYTVMSVLQKGIIFLVTPIYTRMLTTGEYGFFSIYASWQTIIMVVATLNLSAGGFNKGMLKYSLDRNAFISSMQGLANCITLAVFLVLYLIKGFLFKVSGLDGVLLVIMFLVEFFNPSFEYWTAEQRYDYKYKQLSLVTFLAAILTPILSVVLLVYCPHRKYAVIIGNASVQILVGFAFYIRNYIKGHTIFNREYWQFALKFNIPLIPHYISNIILGQSDRLMIKYYYGEGKVGIYSLAYNVALLINIFVSAISTVLGPWTFRRLQQKEYPSIKKSTNTIVIIFAIVIIAAVAIAPEIILFLGTEEYMEAKWIIAPVMLSCFATLIYSLFANVEFFHEKSLYIMMATVFSAITNIVLNVLLIPSFGYLVAGYTTLLSYIILMALHYYGVYKLYGYKMVRQIYNLLMIMTVFFITCIISFFIMSLYKFIVIRYILILAIISMGIIKKDYLMRFLKDVRE